MPLSLRPPFPPMEALAVDEIPRGPEWQYEPKWDGFRCLIFRDGKVYLNGSTRVTKTDIKASNGIIHVINKVLLPPS